jgi:hypothetical protein
LGIITAGVNTRSMSGSHNRKRGILIEIPTHR